MPGCWHRILATITSRTARAGDGLFVAMIAEAVSRRSDLVMQRHLPG